MWPAGVNEPLISSRMSQPPPSPIVSLRADSGPAGTCMQIGRRSSVVIANSHWGKPVSPAAPENTITGFAPGPSTTAGRSRKGPTARIRS